MRTGVGCAILPTSSSVCIIRFMRDASGCVAFLPLAICAVCKQRGNNFPGLCGQVLMRCG